MRTYKKSIILTVASIAAVTAYPQDGNNGELQKSIVIEKDFVPVETEAKKLDVLPQEAPFTAVKTELSFSDWAVPATVEPMLLRQAPMKYSDPSLAPYRKRGYAGFAAGSYLNMVGSAGYRIIDNDRMQLGAWFQHNSTNGSVGGEDGKDDDGYYKQFVSDDKLSLDFSNRFEKGILNANASYHYEKFNYYGTWGKLTYEPFNPFDLSPQNKKQTVNEFNANLKWQNNTESNLRYYAAFDFNYFGYGYGSGLMEYQAPDYNAYLPDGLKEYHSTVEGGIDLAFGEQSSVGIDADFQYLKYNNTQGIAALSDSYYTDFLFHIATPLPSEGFGMLSFTPYYSKKTEHMNLHIGARLDISFNNGTVFRIAPDVRFDLAMSDNVSLSVSATGGNHINTFHETSAVNRYMNPSFELPTTYTIVDARAGLNFGLWRGLSMTPYVGFAVTKDYMLPFVDDLIAIGRTDGDYIYRHSYGANHYMGQTFYKGFDTNGVIAGIKFGYKFKDILELSADYAFTPQGDDSGYILSDDRPEHTVRAVAKVRPIKPLSIVLDYELCALRSISGTHLYYDPTEVAYKYYDTTYPYSNISNLNLGVSYQINDMISVFCQGNNLLNRRYENYYGIYAQELNILGGIGVNF